MNRLQGHKLPSEAICEEDKRLNVKKKKTAEWCQRLVYIDLHPTTCIMNPDKWAFAVSAAQMSS